MRCESCRRARDHAEAEQRTAAWLELRREGWSNKAIAESAGCSPGVVADTLQRSRVARFPNLEWLPAPYAAARGVK